jgi:metal-responsive CopG/Arc/MetJ family transcriptional regulator
MGYELVILDDMKTAISVRDELFERVERALVEHGMNRSQFYAAAAERYLQELGDDSITERINRAVDRETPAARAERLAWADASVRDLAEMSKDEDW